MKTLLAIPALVAGLAAAPALAQDAPDSGLRPYAGVLVGLDHMVAKDVAGDNTKNGFLYGGVIGVDANMGRAVVGVEGEVDGATTRKGFTDALTGDTLRLKAGRDFYVGGRVGIRPTPNMLTYIKAGYTNARFTATGQTGGVPFSDASNEDGYRLGAGVEWQHGPMRARLEYRFSDYGRVNLANYGPTGIGAQRHQVVAGVLFGF